MIERVLSIFSKLSRRLNPKRYYINLLHSTFGSMTTYMTNILDSSKQINILVTNNDEDINNWINCNISLEKNREAFGFDIEWKPNFNAEKPESKTALIQIASKDSVLLAQVFRKTKLPNKLLNILVDRKFIKVGVGIVEDLKKLSSEFCIECKGYIDIGKSAKRFSNIEKTGLFALVNLYYAVNIVKPKSIQMSNWELKHLSKTQIVYAANDAFLSYSIYLRLRNDLVYEHSAMQEFKSEIISYLSDPPISDPSSFIGAGRDNFRYCYLKIIESDLFSAVVQNTIIQADQHILSNIRNSNIKFAKQFCVRLGWVISLKTDTERVQSSKERGFKVFLICNNVKVHTGIGNTLDLAKEDACQKFICDMIEIERLVFPYNMQIQLTWTFLFTENFRITCYLQHMRGKARYQTNLNCI